MYTSSQLLNLKLTDKPLGNNLFLEQQNLVRKTLSVDDFQMTHSITLLVLVHQNIYNSITVAVSCASTKVGVLKGQSSHKTN